MRYRMYNFFEKLGRKLLFLREPHYLDVDCWFSELIDRTKSGSSDNYLDNWEKKYHEQKRREVVFYWFLKKIFYSKIYSIPRNLRLFCSRKVSLFLFWRADRFLYRSHHTISPYGEYQIDGYLTFSVYGLTGKVTLDICSMSDLRFAAKEDGILDLNSYGKWGYTTLLMPKDRIYITDVENAIKKWYSDKVKYRYRHFSSGYMNLEIEFNYE